MAIPEPEHEMTDGSTIEQIVSEVAVAVLDGLILLTARSAEVNLTVPMDPDTARSFASGLILAAIKAEEQQEETPKELDS